MVGIAQDLGLARLRVRATCRTSATSSLVRQGSAWNFSSPPLSPIPPNQLRHDTFGDI